MSILIRDAWTRRTAIRLLVAAAVLVGALLAPSGAAANARGCTPAPFGTVCINVQGAGLHVDKVRVERFKSDPELVCDHQGVMWVSDEQGRRVDTRWSLRHPGCSAGVAWHFWDPNRNYPRKGQLCVAFFERDVRQGAACVKIKRWPWD